ncbi:PREDICTED: protein ACCUMULATION AND REPLICATION OF CHLOROPLASTS 3 [Nelumbo nucifera]|uniref:Protein ACCUMULATION AND REPLICATION OF CHLOROPLASTS 3 n=2 Tax=Nelumbo nucifera TaxID=4432 RepID=A0A1U8B4P5_NELNU|nr:PREDICTED: protein ACCUMULATION AND REPLICATION OF CHLOROPLASTS 3 [Nelumbo nucifera]DAD32536.1 TPA_asm: hypothetical protein HUJ06_011387 [Nelumbo nucifera]
MELVLPTALCTVSGLSSRHSLVKLAFNGRFSRRRLCRKCKRFSMPLRAFSNAEQGSTSNSHVNQEPRRDSDDLWGDSADFVEVIGIGSRKDAIIDFCLESSFELTSLRFWNIILNDSSKLQLIQRSLGEDIVQRNVEGPQSLQSCPRAMILVASAGYGLDHMTAIELLGTVKSTNGLAVGVVLKPFSFEGQRRQDEVKALVSKIQEHTNFCIVVDTDALLRKEVLTLAEALKSANNAVLLCINAISILVSENHMKLLDAPCNKIKELKVAEVLNILEIYKEAKVGFGAAHNIKSSIAKAVFDCPFLGGGIRESNGLAICTIASAVDMDSSYLHSFLHTFRETTQCTRDIIISMVHEPKMEPNLIVTTVMVLSCDKQKVSMRKSLLSELALRFPFVFSLLGVNHPESSSELPSDLLENPLSGNMPNLNSLDSKDEDMGVSSEELAELSNNCDGISNMRTDVEILKESTEVASDMHDQVAEGGLADGRELLVSLNVGPGFYIAQEWAKERAVVSVTAPMLANLSVYTLPVGVKSSEKVKDDPKVSYTTQFSEKSSLEDFNADSLGTPTMPSWDTLTDAGFEAVTDIYNAASTLIKGKFSDIPRKQGLLSVRAASMLEAERDVQKKWSPITEIQYRGGIYRGRCQGGLPEGKGRLTLADGSMYDGMWRYGKRSGLGTFYYSNGDVFQGSWRDDLMHGKGWYYFHTGDRWFANFWKGKANGEGRFYSKFGDVFFGHFQDGWRHGNFLCIDVDGTRWSEIWEEGVLVSRKQLDSENDAE